jgi:phospholipase/carboxylesterase
MSNRRETQLLTFEDWTFRLSVPALRPARLMLLLHGWTGDENSMWVFARNLPATRWMLAPRAPFESPMGGFSWRRHVEQTHYAEDFAESAARLLEFVTAWGRANAVETDSFDVMGFSQGAAMAYMLALHAPGRVHRLAGLAGFLPRELGNLLDGNPLAGKDIFITHGATDEMVPLERAYFARDALKQAGANVIFCESEVGHKVGADCMRALDAFWGA